jgi:S-adenosylmethionine:tRNA ribosyltransferase-isomerase
LDYDLPQERIAKYPLAERDGARMLVIGRDELVDSSIRAWPDLVPSGALVVVNNTRVFKARLFGRREPGGGRVEVLLLTQLHERSSTDTSQRWRALGRASKPLRSGSLIQCDSLRVTVESRDADGELVVQLQANSPIAAIIDRVGHVPIPPYLGRGDEPIDSERYQTVFAQHIGSVAAPTAGLHLSEPILQRLQRLSVTIASITLHVGLGTFRPVLAPDLDLHPMHEEVYEISERLVGEVRAARERGAPVIAIGTTVVRALESASDPSRIGHVLAQRASTRLLIQPGYAFKVVDGLLTNFHMPKSTLLALVGAFAGFERMLDAYRVAIRRGYRFLSYGDATWIPERLQ